MLLKRYSWQDKPSVFWVNSLQIKFSLYLMKPFLAQCRISFIFGQKLFSLLAYRLISIKLGSPRLYFFPLLSCLIGYLAIHDDLWPADAAKPTSRSGGHDLACGQNVVFQQHTRKTAVTNGFVVSLRTSHSELKSQSVKITWWFKFLVQKPRWKSISFRIRRVHLYFILKINCSGLFWL